MKLSEIPTERHNINQPRSGGGGKRELNERFIGKVNERVRLVRFNRVAISNLQDNSAGLTTGIRRVSEFRSSEGSRKKDYARADVLEQVIGLVEHAEQEATDFDILERVEASNSPFRA